MAEINEQLTPNLYDDGLKDRRIYVLTSGYVLDHLKNKDGDITHLYVENGYGGGPCKIQLTSLNKRIWSIPQKNDTVLYGYIEGNISNGILVTSLYDLFGTEATTNLIKWAMPNGAIFQVDDSGNFTFTIPGTSQISSVGASEIKTTGDDKDILIDTTKGNITITAVGSGKKVTINFGGASVVIENGKVTIADGTGTIILNSGQMNVNSGNLTVDP